MTSASVLLAASLLLLTECSPPDPWASQRAELDSKTDAVEAFAAAGIDSITVYSLDGSLIRPEEDLDADARERFNSTVTATEFHKYGIMASVVITDKAHSARIMTATAAGMRVPMEDFLCFAPHHGLRLKRGEVYMDLVICYTCAEIDIWATGKPLTGCSTSNVAQTILDEALKAATPP